MSIRNALRGFYPIDWRQLSDVVRFERAKVSCVDLEQRQVKRFACRL